MKYFFLFLLLGFLCLGDLSAQVGINNPNPSQALDVGGKIKVGDDQIDPVAGTIRYNRVAKTFEGFDGTGWSVFNPEPEDGGGNNSPVSGDIVRAEISLIGIPPNVNSEIQWYYGDSNTERFVDLPAGKSIRITSILIAPGDVSNYYKFRLFARNNQGLPYPERTLTLTGNLYNYPGHVIDPSGQIFKVPAGGTAAYLADDFTGVIRITGFLE